MNEWTVRHAAREDFATWHSAWAGVVSEGRWIGAEHVTPPDQMAPWFEDRLADPNRLNLVADADGVVGYLHADPILPGVFEPGMWIDKQSRGRGIGSALMKNCIQWCRDRGAHKIVLEVWPHNQPALGMYERFGFIREGLLSRHWRRANGELWDLVVLGLVLDTESPGSQLS